MSRIERIGNATLYLGDCRDILPTIGKVDLVLTDPPYSHKHMDGGGFASGSAFYREGSLDGLNDFDLSQYAALMIDAAPMMIAFHSRDLIHDYAILARSVARKYDLHVWHKTNAIPFTANTWKSDLEYIALIWERKPGWVQLHQLQHSKVYSSPINRDSAHPAAKPVPLLSRYIRVLDADTLLDPFMGSGTTGVACAKLGRQFIGIEISEKYFDIACQRIGDAYSQTDMFIDGVPA